jgi:hypothetical protein
MARNRLFGQLLRPKRLRAISSRPRSAFLAALPIDAAAVRNVIIGRVLVL